MTELAIGDITVDTVVASIPEIKDIETTANKLATALDMDEGKLKEQMPQAQKTKNLLYTSSAKSVKKNQQLCAIKTEAFILQRKIKFYPERNLASHVVLVIVRA